MGSVNGKFLREGWKKGLWMKEGVGLFLSEKVNFFFELPIWVGSSLTSLGHLAAQGEGVNDFRVWNERHGLLNVLKSVRIWGQGSLYFGAWSVGIEPWFWCILGNHSSTEICPSHW